MHKSLDLTTSLSTLRTLNERFIKKVHLFGRRGVVTMPSYDKSNCLRINGVRIHSHKCVIRLIQDPSQTFNH